MARTKHTSSLDAKAFLAEIAKRWPMAKGSLAQVRKPCIRPRCQACASGRKHQAFLFSFIEKGRQRCMYVPRELVPLLRKAIENGRWLEYQLKGMGKQLIEDHRRQRKKTSRSATDGQGAARRRSNGS